MSVNFLPPIGRSFSMFSSGRTLQAIRARETSKPSYILKQLGLIRTSGLILVNGGANSLDATKQSQLTILLENVLAPLAANRNLLIIDGGSNQGVMAANGLARAKLKNNYFLLGIAPGGVLSFDNGPKLAPTVAAYPVDPNHSHIILVGTGSWGSETEFMFKVVGEISQGVPSVAVICGGGRITAKEALCNIRQNRPIILIKKSGGFTGDLIEACATGKVRAVTSAEGSVMVAPEIIAQVIARKELIRVVEIEDSSTFAKVLETALEPLCC